MTNLPQSYDLTRILELDDRLWYGNDLLGNIINLYGCDWITAIAVLHAAAKSGYIESHEDEEIGTVFTINFQ